MPLKGCEQAQYQGKSPFFPFRTLAIEMANFEKSSADGSDQAHKPGNPAYLIDERRRAALAEIDNAKFS